MKLIFILSFLLGTTLAPLFAQSRLEKLFDQGDYDGAIQLFLHKEKEGKAVAADYRVAARVFALQFNYTSAMEGFRRALQFDSLDALSREGLADAQVSLGLKKEAFDHYSLLLLSDSLNRNLRAKQAALLMDFDRYAEAEEAYETLYQTDSTMVFFLRRLAIARYKQKKYGQVLALLHGNKAVQTHDLELHMIVADCFYRLNNNHEAINRLQSILQVDSLYAPALSKLGYIHFSAYRNYEEAIVCYRTLNRIEKYSDPFHLKNLGICEYFTGNHEYAGILLDSLADELNDDPIIPFYAGLSYKKTGDTDNALRCLERAVAVVIPSYTADIYHHLGRAYAAKRMFDKAIETYQKAREYDPNNFQVLFDIAVTYEEWNRNQIMALPFYQQFISECMNPRSVDLDYAKNRVEKIKEELFFEGH